MQVFVKMCKEGVAVDAVTCCSLINAMDKARHWALAEVVFSGLCRSNPDLAPLIPPPLSPADGLSDFEIELVHLLEDCMCLPRSRLREHEMAASCGENGPNSLSDLVNQMNDVLLLPQEVCSAPLKG
jgi:hypothetical protein